MNNMSKDVTEAHGYGMRFELMIVSIHVSKVQIRQLQNCFVTDEDLRS